MVASNHNVYTGDNDDEEDYRQHYSKKKSTRKSHSKSFVHKRRRRRSSEKDTSYYHQSIEMESSSREAKDESRSSDHLYHQTITMGLDSSKQVEHKKRTERRNNKKSRHNYHTKKPYSDHHYSNRHHSSHKPHHHHTTDNHRSEHKHSSYHHIDHKHEPTKPKSSEQKDEQEQQNHNINADDHKLVPETSQKPKLENKQHKSDITSKGKANQVVNMIINMAEMGVLNPGCQMCAIKFLEEALFGEFALLANFVNRGLNFALKYLINHHFLAKTLKRMRLVIDFVKGGQGKMLIAEAEKVLNPKVFKAVGKEITGTAGIGVKVIEGGGKVVAKQTINKVISPVANVVVKPEEEVKKVENVATGAGKKMKKLFG